MTPEHEALVRATWAAAAPRAAAMVDRFYQELFARSPESRALFDRVDREALARKFQLTLGEIVAVLDDPARLVSVLGPLGRHHAGLGVRSAHYEVALGALIAALRETCGEVFTAEAEEAWRELYNLVAAVMKRGGREEVILSPA